MTNVHDHYRDWMSEVEDDPAFRYELVLLEISEQIYLRMEEAGVSRAQLAERLGVTRARVSQLLSATGNPTLKTLVDVAQALGSQIRISLEPRYARAAPRPDTKDWSIRQPVGQKARPRDLALAA